MSRTCTFTMLSLSVRTHVSYYLFSPLISSVLCRFQYTSPQFSSVVQFSCSVMSNSFETPWIAVRQAFLSVNNSQSLLKLLSISRSIEPVIPSNHLILSRTLLPPSVFSSIRVFFNESVLCIRRPKYWSFSFIIILPMNSQD